MGAICVLSFPLRAQDFDALKWENRVLVISANENSALAREQIIALLDHLEELEEREVVVLRLNNSVLKKVDELSPFPFQTIIFENPQERRYLQNLFSRDIIGDSDMRVTLVGLDGQLKEAWSGVVDPKEIFDVIDAMPMRQDEINQ